MWDKAMCKIRVERISGQGKAAGLVCIFMLALFSFCFRGRGNKDAAAPAIGKGKPLVVWIASDLHFLSPGLTDGGALFSRTVESGDGKMVGDSEKIVENPYMKEIYLTRASREALEVFCIAEGSGEYCDARTRPESLYLQSGGSGRKRFIVCHYLLMTNLCFFVLKKVVSVYYNKCRKKQKTEKANKTGKKSKRRSSHVF